ncbi:hypothetical protein F8M41_006107 [Gigaspora margarita]|uniref:PNPLA domain-containing protein n=1 Tax=Gigaspora margarita TaxID=4874 RepID=A0A8H3X9J9_GIGMA|nr:hypothetical protein F8M41_006107 [Gigaspora margarita]
MDGLSDFTSILAAQDENQHGLYSYKYHTTYYSYLRAIGDTENANKQERLAKRCEKFTNTRTEGTQFILYVNCVTSNDINQDNTNLKEILKELNKIRPILENELVEINVVDKLISEMQLNFEKLNRITKTFEANNDSEEHENSSEIKNVSTELINHMRCLKLFAHETAYSKRIEFISCISDAPNKMEILFNNIVNTEEEINRRSRILSKWFHPDRTKNKDCLFVLQEIYKTQGDELFKLILGFKEHLLNKLKKSLELEDYENHGNELWKITIDYHNASKGQWNKLKLLKKDDIKELSSELLKQNSMLMGELAYHQYQAACKIADKAKILKRQVKLRGHMALCLYFTKKFLEASLYALVAMLLQIRDPNITQQELNETKKIFDKVNGGSKEKEKSEEGMSPDLNADIKLENDFNNAIALIRIKNQAISINDRANIMNTINKSLINTTTKLFIKVEHNYQTSNKEILHTIEHAKTYRAKGFGIMVSGGIFGGAISATAVVDIYRAISATGITSLTGPVGLVTGVACLVGGYYFGYLSHKKGKEIFKEPIIREQLNIIITKALSAYDVKKYQEFINALSEEYDDEHHKQLLDCHGKIGITGIDDIVDILQRHGFRSDGIAYLLVVLGEVLASGKIKIKDSILSTEHTKLALEYLEDSQEMPFFSRLEEMRNIARTNIAILNIIEHDDEAYEEPKETIEEVRNSVDENFQFVGKAKLRLEVLEDFLWILSGEDLPNSNGSFFITFPDATKSNSELDDKYINYLNNQKSFNQNKYYYKAVYFERLAEKEDKINKLNSLRYWQLAQENYNIAHEIDPYNQIFFSWICKQKKYKDAITCNTEALNLDPGNISAGKYRELIKKFNVDNKIEHHIDRYKKELTYKIDYLKNSHSDESPSYKILSIDGGGIRGILPALWLSEIEYQTHRPISHLFNMIAGTSTGRIIATGLSTPQFKPFYETTDEYTDHIEYEYSNLIPIFSASELLNIYKNELNKLFSKSISWFNIFSNERKTIFENYFGETRLSHSLTELVIPATNDNCLHLFTHYDTKNSKNNEVNNTFVDLLMATTATPTFYLPHKISNKTFKDGGIYLNNPASTAYDEAIRYNVSKEKISVLSLDTGCYLPDPSNPDQYSNLLFWTQNQPKMMISTQEYETDCRMYKELKNRYQRWQVFFEEPIRLDVYESIPNLLELGYQYIEELDCSDENPINTLVESFDLEIGIDQNNISRLITC